MKTRKRIVLISAELSTLTGPENEQRTSNLKTLLNNKNYKFNAVMGSYKGSIEHSFIVDASEDIVGNLKALASYFKQESILVVDEMNKAALHYFNGKVDQLGEMIQVNSISGLDSWTLVNQLFYTVK